ncbi:MAG TPA: HAD-IB family hydrolase [Blastocatellia bacterium]|nr:HAD-IB family hydrolase [Blastocatellia bacterium]
MAHKNIAAVFDADGTLIAGDSLERIFFRYLWRYGEIGLCEMARLAGGAMCALLAGRAAMADNKAYLRGQDARRLRKLARDCFEQEIARRLLPGAVARLRWHQSAGHEVILLSGTLDVLLEPLAEYLGVDMRIGTAVEVSDQRLTGRIASARPFGMTKLTCLMQMIRSRNSDSFDLARSFAYADTYADRFVMSAVGHPVAANPDRRLRHVAEKCGWMIEQFV